MRTSRLYRYIARRFLWTILLVFGLCLVIIFMVDFVEILRQSNRAEGVAFSQIVWITLLRLPSYGDLTLPFAVLVGSMGAFLLLSRSSELVVVRAAGFSVWQFTLPGMIVACLLGFAANYGLSPLAATARAASEDLQASIFGSEQNLLANKSGGAWLRQDGIDGSSVISAGFSADNGLSLADVTVLQFDRDGRFIERVDGSSAKLRDGYWDVRDAWVSRTGQPPEQFAEYQLSTYLSPEEVNDALGSVYSLSFLQLPAAIEHAEKAGLSPTRYQVQYEILKSRPMLFIAMVLLAGTVSLQTFRQGKIQTKVIIGMLAGFGFFILAEASRQVGVAGLTLAWVSAWAPIVIVGLGSATVLLHQEDG
jgi:lipopolysaccharide export system permease protein